MKQQYSFLIKLLIVSCLLGWVFLKIDFKEMQKNFTHLHFFPLIWVFFSLFVNRILIAVKWQCFLEHSGISSSLPSLIRIIFISNFLGLFLPSSLGVDAARLLHIHRQEGNFKGSLGSILIDRILSVFTLASFSFVALLFAWTIILKKTVLYLAFSLCLGVILLTFLLLFSNIFPRIANTLLDHLLPLSIREKTKKNLSHMHHSFQSLLKTPKTFFWVIFLGILVQLLRVVQIHYLFHCFGIQLSFLLELVLVPLIIVFTLLPISIGGFGIKESSFVYFFSSISISPNTALSVALLSHAVQLIFFLPGGLLLLTTSCGGHSLHVSEKNKGSV